MANIKTFNTRISMKHDTTAHWNANPTFVGIEGEIIVYDDRYVLDTEIDGQQIYIPGIKICDGKAYLADLPFIDYVTNKTLNDHMSNSTIHVTQADRDYWDNKMNSETIYDAASENLTFTK